jgi:hypothetical protein
VLLSNGYLGTGRRRSARVLEGTQAVVGNKRHRAGAAVASSVLLIVEECRARVSD